MPRKPVHFTFKTQPISVTENSLPEICLQLASRLGSQAFLLAFADDGVIWGRVEDGTLPLSSQAFPQISPPLRRSTIQHLHIFNQNQGEIRLWRDKNTLRAVHITDHPASNPDAMDESYILWGTRAVATKDGFTLVEEGLRGFRHAVPIQIDSPYFKNGHPLRLEVRHYLAYDETGSATIALTRLLTVKGVKA